MIATNLLTLAVPLTQDLEKDNNHSFHYMAGSVELPDSWGMEEYFGPGPHLRFLESSWPGASDQQLYEVLRRAPLGLTPEEKHRYLERHLPPKTSLVFKDMLLGIHRVFDDEGPFDCVLGHSEGAAVAATFIIDCLNNATAGKNVVKPKYAVFISGSLPYAINGQGRLSADECGQLITIPTCHILGYNDVLVDQAVGLFHLCKEELATMVDHGRGHAIPKDAKSWRLIISCIRELMARAEA